MTISSVANFLANIASVITAVVAVGFWWRTSGAAKRRVQAVETYLKEQRKEDRKSHRTGARSMIHMMANLSMTEEQIYAAVFSSKDIKTWPAQNEEGIATRLMFQYVPKT